MGLWNAVGQVWPQAAAQRGWNHQLRNGVESPFAAVRLRTSAAKRFKTVERAEAMIWRRRRVAEQRFRKRNAPEPCRDVFDGHRYVDGVEVSTESSTQKAAA